MQTSQTKLSILIPCFNEERVILNTLKRVQHLCDTHGICYEIIVIDDGSDDSTASLVREFIIDIDAIHIICLTENQGKGAAIGYGVEQAMGTYIAYIDADLETSPDCLVEYLRILETEKEIDIVVGSKFVTGAKSRKAPVRRIASRLLEILNRMLFSLAIKDTQVGLKLFKKSVAKKLFKDQKINGYAFDIELLVQAQMHNFVIKESPVHITQSIRTSRLGWKTILKMLKDIMYIYRKSIPLRIEQKNVIQKILFLIPHGILYLGSYIVTGLIHVLGI